MSKENMRRPVLEKNRSSSKHKELQKPNYNLLSKHLKKVYPVGLYKASTSPLSLSSLSLSLSQNSTDSSYTDSSSTIEQKIAAALRLIVPREKRDVPTVAKYMQKLSSVSPSSEGFNRCNWITANSGELHFNSMSLFCVISTLILIKHIYALYI